MTKKYQTLESAIRSIYEAKMMKVSIKGEGVATVPARSEKEAITKAFRKLGIATRFTRDAKFMKGVSVSESVDEHDNCGTDECCGTCNEEQIDELSRNTVGNYMSKSAASVSGKDAKTQDKRIKGQSMADKKLRKADGYSSDAKVAATEEEIKEMEEFVQLDEILPAVAAVAGRAAAGAVARKGGGKIAQKVAKVGTTMAVNKATSKAASEGAMSRMATQDAEKERLGPNKVKGTGLKTFKKKPAAKDTMVASPKTQRVKMTTAKAAKRMVAKGAVYAEDSQETVDEAQGQPVGVSVTMKHKDSGKKQTTKFPGTHSAVAGAKSHIAQMQKKGYQVHSKNLMYGKNEAEEMGKKVKGKKGEEEVMINPTVKEVKEDALDERRLKKGLGGNLPKHMTATKDEIMKVIGKASNERAAIAAIKKKFKVQDKDAKLMMKGIMESNEMGTAELTKNYVDATPGQEVPEVSTAHQHVAKPEIAPTAKQVDELDDTEELSTYQKSLKHVMSRLKEIK
jgi:hypothetical protein